MVTIKLRQLLRVRNSSTSINSGNDMNQYDIDDENDDIKEAHNDLAASIANRELLLTAAAMKHTDNNNNKNNKYNNDISLLRDEIEMLRDEMRERFDVLEKKFTINFDNSLNNSVHNVDVSMDSKSVYEDKFDDTLVSPVANDKLEAEDGTEITSNQKKAEDDIGGTSNTHSVNKQNKEVLDKVVNDNMAKVIVNDKSIHVVEELLEDEDTAGDIVVREKKLNVAHEELNIEEKQQEETLITPHPTRLLKKGKRNKPRKQRAKGKRRQKKKNKSPPSSSTSIIPTAGYNGILTFFVTLIKAIPTLLLTRGGKRLYMLLAFIAASYLFKEEMNSFSDTSAVDDISRSSGGWFSIGSFSFIQGVRALEDCPDQYIGTDIDSYSIGSKVTIEEKVYECTESPCGWRIIGTCVGDMFLSSSASAQPTIQTSGMPVHFPSMMTPALDAGGGESDLFESESVPAESSLGRVRTHSTGKTRQGLFRDDDGENTQTLYYPDYVLAKCVTDAPTIFDSNQSSATIEECCDQWLFYINRDDCITKSSPVTHSPTQSGVDTVSPTSLRPSLVLGTASPIKISPPDDDAPTDEWPTMSPDTASSIINVPMIDDTDSKWPTYPPLTYPPTTSPTSSTYPTITAKPTTSISPSMHPTISPNPTISLAPTLGPQCEGSNPKVCGCASVNQADYRGTINTTISGKVCIRWDETLFYKPEDYPDAGLENNYCRKPDDWNDWRDRAWCITADGDEECDVPICEDSLPSAYPSSSPPTISSLPTCSLKIDINIVYDKYPEETSWKLYKVDTNEDTEIESHTALEGDASYTKSICLEDGEYNFIISDLSYDGINSPGFYTVTTSGQVLIAKGGEFEGSESVLFSLPFIPYPSTSPSSSPRPTTTTRSPTISPNPTTSSPTPEPQCEGSNPNICGCGSVDQADYRGTINTTASGKGCNRWDGDDFWVGTYPDAGLENNNYCRNPNEYDHSWCFAPLQFRSSTVNGDGEDCDVPYCFPLASSCLSALDGNTNTSSMSEELQQACAYHQCVVESDYELDGYIAPKRAEVKPDCACLFEQWDCQFGSKECERSLKNDYECCASKFNDSNSTSQAASCECLIKPSCEAGDSAKCNEFAEYCCDENDQQCKCEYQTKACRLALESDNEEVSAMALEYCGRKKFSFIDYNGVSVYYGGAQDACCGEDNYDIGLCTCDFWMPLCTDFPNAEYDTCTEASRSCCDGKLWYKDDFDGSSTTAPAVCAGESNIAPDRDVELQSLQSIYNETGGEYWINNTGWKTEQDQCNWYGITCDEEGYVIEINLPNNNVTGKFPSISLSSFYNLQRIVLGNNSLHGIMAATYDANAGYDDDIPAVLVNDSSLFFNLRDLAHVDLSQNNLSGEVDVLFAPALQYANFSHNNFTSINSFKKFKRSQQTLIICDLSHNSINTSTIDLMTNVPPNIEQFIMSSNLIHGSLLISSLEELASLRRFDMSMNSLSGELPDFSNVYPNLQALDLLDQGLVGNIPESLVNLAFLSNLNLGGNQLSGGIPPVLGNMGQLRVLNLSSNKLSETIPKELGKLADLELFDLSNNTLTGQIPFELDNLLAASIHLDDNSDMMNPAPLELCFHPMYFDLKSDISKCPTERNALKDFYDSSKGGEWTVSTYWVDPYISHCQWYGIKCKEDTNEHITVSIELPTNGLSGTLSKSISNLSMLEVLDLSDNDVKGTIPSEIGMLSNLNRLSLKYNSFVKNAPNEMTSLQELKLIQIQGNRISGTIPELNLPFLDPSSYISDCGNPSNFEESLVCTECTMCCNAQEDCYPQEDSAIQKSGFTSYVQFSWIFIAILIGTSCVLALGVYAYDKYKNRELPRSSLRRASVTNRDKKYALSTLGDGSVYQFFLGTSITGWIIVLLTLATQVGMLFVFVEGAEVDLSDDNIDLIYSWKCSRDQDDCRDTSDLTWRGWTVFGVLMATHLLKDLINGIKMIILSAKERHEKNTRARYFVGGTLMATVTSFTLYVSTIYNAAIATSNTEIIANSVIILFIMDIDELLYDILEVINVGWVKGMSLDDGDEEDGDLSEMIIRRLQSKVQRLEKKDMLQTQTMKVNSQNIELMIQHIPALKDLKLIPNVVPIAQDDDDSDNEDDMKDDVKV